MTFLKKTLAGMAILGMVAAPALADGHKFELSLGGAFQKFDDDRVDGDDELDSGFGPAIGLGYVINPRWTVEAWWSEIDTETDDSNIDVDTREYRFDTLYHLNTAAEGIRPFFVGGVGNMEFDAEGSDEDDETRINFGMGLKKSMGKHLDLRGDVRAFHSLDESDTDMGMLLALTYKLGHKPAPVAEPEPEVVRVDSDGDGVYDDEDLCPDTPKEFAVDATGCPIAVVDTIIVNLQVNFDTDKAVVQEGYMPQIKELAEFMARFTETNVEIEGHTDSTGPAEYNANLSQRRADAVAKILIEEYGVDADRLTTVGHGEDHPIATNETAEGRAQNRRVLAEISVDEESMKLRD